MATLVAWGDAECGGSLIPEKVSQVDGGLGIAEVAATKCAFAVRTRAGGVVNWGGKFYGGDRDPAGDPGASVTFDAAEGDSTDGLHAVSLNQGLLSGKLVTALAATQFAFAAVLDDKTVVAWGDAASGGKLSSADLGAITDHGGVAKLHSNNVAFAAITADSKAYAWGNVANGGVGDLSVSIGVDGIVKSIRPSGSAFTATVVSGI